ncbi:peptidylprolyl isomerase [Neobacillus sp. PS2-9]|uniref:peptidylprolyl isomerase n=1 Tax=Neobacillus sp. PS2-9 TaxID=3070676 RepID=UPI0027E1939B|nr:peptidylprolyl isomerase [Neobacillus sp. PS2-9]WML56632.1 peptidylprolyl isomerase [Neobacillus sp. PS2-9]
MKKLILTGLIISALGLSACTSSNSTVVKSDAGNISQDELYQAMKSKYGTQTLQQLLVEKVLSKEYSVSKSDIDAEVKKSKEQLGDQFLPTLQQYGYKTEDDFRKSVKLNLLEKKAVHKTVKVTDKELQDAYAAYKPDIQARHILVEDEKTANDIEAKLKKGEKFEDLAKQSSKDTASATKGGDLGWFGSGVMDPDFEKAAFALKQNEISAPVKTQFGYHIIQVTGIKEKQSFDKMKDTMTDQVKDSKVTQDMIMKVLKAEFKKANIKISDKDLKSAAEFTSPAATTNS